MVRTYELEGNNVYEVVNTVSGSMRSFIGTKTKTETVRIDAETVADVVYQFDIELGKYVEVSRTERHDPLPPPVPTPEDRLTQLEDDLLQAKLALAELAEVNDQDKTEIQLALAEIAELIAGGE